MSKASQMVSRASGPNAAPSCITGVGTVGEALIRGRDDQHDLPCLRIGHAGGHDASLPFKPAPIIYGVSRHRVQRSSRTGTLSSGPYGPRENATTPENSTQVVGRPIGGMPNNSVGSLPAGILRHLPAMA